MAILTRSISNEDVKILKTSRKITEDKFEQLTYCQQFAAESLVGFGYKLVHAVHINDKTIAILRSKDKYATVSADGRIEMNQLIN